MAAAACPGAAAAAASAWAPGMLRVGGLVAVETVGGAENCTGCSPGVASPPPPRHHHSPVQYVGLGTGAGEGAGCGARVGAATGSFEMVGIGVVGATGDAVGAAAAAAADGFAVGEKVCSALGTGAGALENVGLVVGRADGVCGAFVGNCVGTCGARVGSGVGLGSVGLCVGTPYGSSVARTAPTRRSSAQTNRTIVFDAMYLNLVMRMTSYIL